MHRLGEAAVHAAAQKPTAMMKAPASAGQNRCQGPIRRPGEGAEYFVDLRQVQAASTRNVTPRSADGARLPRSAVRFVGRRAAR